VKKGLPIIPTQWQTARRTKLPIGFPTAAELAHLHSVFDEVAAHVAKRRNAALARTLFPAPRRVEAPPPRRLQVVIDRPRRGRRALAVYLQGNGKLRGWPGAASIQLRSVNRKITAVDTVELKATGLFRVRLSPRAPFTCTTYASIEATCPTSCDFKGSGCYAQTGYTRFAGIRLDRAAAGVSGDDVIREEATAIRAAFNGRQVPQDGARGGRDLRLHIAGDVSSAAGARLLGDAAEDWRRRGGGSVWSFTHRWSTIRRSAWGPAISVLASVEHPRQFAAARAQGYAPAIVVERFPNGGKSWRADGLKVIPCPAETTETTCSQCRLCLDRDLVKMNAAIAFAVHGRGTKLATAKLLQIRRRP
jgi:hypothetical protein